MKYNAFYYPRDRKELFCIARWPIALMLSCLFILGFASTAQAGFGISPPFVQNDQLTRGSQFQQKIVLVRSDPAEDLQATVTVDVPEASGWFSIDRGMEFLLPKGERQVPMVVTVNIPEDADFRSYTGNMRVVISSPGGPQSGTVGISLGAQIDVDLGIVDRKIFEFKVRTISISDLEEGHEVWWMYFPGKIRFGMKIENTGNVPASPTRVEMDIYDAAGKTLLESIVNTNKIPFVPPFETETVHAELPTRLPPGTYRARYRIYNADKIVQENELRMTILPYGSLPDYEGYGIAGLHVRDKMILGGGLLVLVFGFGFGGWQAYTRVTGRSKKRSLFRLHT